jgi:hypothetical protein
MTTVPYQPWVPQLSTIWDEVGKTDRLLVSYRLTVMRAIGQVHPSGVKCVGLDIHKSRGVRCNVVNRVESGMPVDLVCAVLGFLEM